jgi:hypothetical protein
VPSSMTNPDRKFSHGTPLGRSLIWL